MSVPALVAAAHGSRDPAAAAELERLAELVRRRRPGLPVHLAYLEQARPTLAGALRAAGADAVVVPLLLAGGFHARVDLPEQAAGHPGVRVARPLGPDAGVLAAVADRLAALPPGDPAAAVVLAAAGSRDPTAVRDVQTAARRLSDRLGRPVAAAYASAARPRLEAALHRAGDRAVVAAYVLAPGRFADDIARRAAAAGAGAVSAPVGAHPAVADAVLDRYDEALAPRRQPTRTAPA